MNVTAARYPWLALRRRAALGPLLLWVLVAVVAALGRSERGQAAVDAYVTTFLGPVVLPLTALALATALLGRQSLRSAAAPLELFGAPRGGAVTAYASAVPLACALAGLVLGVATVALAGAAAGAPSLRDALTTGYVGALGGAAYGSLFVLGSTFGARGGGRIALLLVDLAAGSRGGLAWLLPRAHVNNLMGASVRLPIAPRWSAVALVAVAAVLFALAVRRARRLGDGSRPRLRGDGGAR